jgi:hypothetical protein
MDWRPTEPTQPGVRTREVTVSLQTRQQSQHNGRQRVFHYALHRRHSLQFVMLHKVGVVLFSYKGFEEHEYFNAVYIVTYML